MRARSHTFYFGPKDRPLFGALHTPEQWNGARILLCPPLGYEATFAQLTLSDLAARLADATGAVVMRFDYDGLGDSAGTDEEPDRVGAALRSVNHAIDHLKALSAASGPLLVIGLRAGALFGAHAAAKRDDVDAVALWAPCASGRAYLREQRAFSQLTEANHPDPTGLAQPWGAQGFEANGYVFTDETVRELEALSFKSLERAPASKILVLHRNDLPGSLQPGVLWPNATAEEHEFPGFEGMMEPPWLYTSPTAALDAVAAWAQRIVGERTRNVPLPTLEQTPGLVLPSIEEVPVRFGEDARLFGILTRPISAKLEQALIIVTSTFGYRIGSSRANVLIARRLAKSNVATFRVDVEGVGESRVEREVAAPSPYDPRAIADALAAVKHLRSLGYTKITVCGVCAGAYVAWEAALASHGPVDVLLVNSQTWEENIHYDRELHSKFLSPNPALKNGERLSRIWSRVRHRAKFALQLAWVSLPSDLQPSALPSKLRKFQREGARLVLVFSKGDSGLRQYFRSIGAHHVRLHLQKTVKIRIVDGPDHSFTPRWAVERLGAVVLDELKLLASTSGHRPARRRAHAFSG